MKRCLILRLGLVEYGEAWELQKKIFNARQLNQIEDVLIVLQHPPTFTLGRRNKKTNHLLVDEGQLRNMGFSIYRVDRGGATTYHGPGQVVCYPVIGMNSYTNDFGHYLRMLEKVMIKTLLDYDIESERVEEYTGAWVDNKKVGFIGVRIAAGATMHGFSLNVNNDLSPFNMIIPCGICDVMITSMSELLKTELDIEGIMNSVIRNFADIFKVEVHTISQEEILEEISENKTPQLAQG